MEHYVVTQSHFCQEYLKKKKKKKEYLKTSGKAHDSIPSDQSGPQNYIYIFPIIFNVKMRKYIV